MYIRIHFTPKDNQHQGLVAGTIDYVLANLVANLPLRVYRGMKVQDCMGRVSP